MSPLNAAQIFIFDLISRQTGRDYRAPHANRGTPARARFPRTPGKARLFKGHRV